MKKLLVLILSLALLLFSTFAVAETATEVGNLYLISMSADGGENWMDTTGLMEITFTFYDDGTVNMLAYGESIPGTYTAEGDNIVISSGDSDPVTLVPIDETTYEAAEGDQVMRFSLIQPEGIALPATVAAEDISAFDGTWNPELISAMGMVLSLEDAMGAGLGDLLGEEITSAVVIDNGKANLLGEDMSFEFADGALRMDVPMAGESMTMTIELCEDGRIVYSMGSLGIAIYYAK